MCVWAGEGTGVSIATLRRTFATNGNRNGVVTGRGQVPIFVFY